MTVNEFTAQHVAVIRRFVNDPLFLEIKDAFISHTPEQGNDGRIGESDSKNLGKLLGTRYVLNQLEKISRQTPKKLDTGKKSNERSEETGDPDLE